MLIGAVLVIVGMFARLAGSVFMPGSVARAMAVGVMKFIGLVPFARDIENETDSAQEDNEPTKEWLHRRHSRHPS